MKAVRLALLVGALVLIYLVAFGIGTCGITQRVGS